MLTKNQLERVLQMYSKSKLELKKSSWSVAKIFSVFISFLFALKARLQVLKFEFCQIKLE